MAVMKIRGGDLDLVEYEFITFHPGENIRTLGLERFYPLSPVKARSRSVHLHGSTGPFLI